MMRVDMEYEVSGGCVFWRYFKVSFRFELSLEFQRSLHNKVDGVAEREV